MSNATTPALAAAAAAVIDTTPAPRGTQYRATHHGLGGGAAIGYGATPDEARAHLLAVLEFNVAHNGRLV
jgi:hypothetical protein